MALRKVTKPFYAFRLTSNGQNPCNELEGHIGEGDILFPVGRAPLNDGFNPQIVLVNGSKFVHFTFSQSSFGVERSIYEASTENIKTESSKEPQQPRARS
jgi:hypothetical protein